VTVHVDTTAHFSLLAQYFYQVTANAIKTYICRRRGSACRYDCTFLLLILCFDDVQLI